MKKQRSPLSAWFRRLGEKPDVPEAEAPADAVTPSPAALHRLLLHGWRRKEELRTLLDSLSLTDAPQARYLCLQLCIDQYDALMAEHGLAAAQAKKEALLAVCGEIFPAGRYTFTEDHAIGIVLMRESLFDPAQLDEVLQAFRSAQALSQAGLEITIGIGTHALAPDKIHESYRNAQIAARYRFIYGYGQDIEYETIRARSSTNNTYPARLEREIIEAVRHDDLVRLEQKVTHFFELACTGSVEFIHLSACTLCMQIHGSLSPEAQQESALSKLYLKLQQCEHWTDMMRAVLAFALTNMSFMSKGEDLQVVQRAADIAQFIEENYQNPDLSVVSIAESLHISQNLIRLALRTAHNITPRELIQDTRMRHACELLQKTDLTAKDIAEQVGYKDSRYFYNVFKKHTGMTAFAYRQEREG